VKPGVLGARTELLVCHQRLAGRVHAAAGYRLWRGRRWPACLVIARAAHWPAGLGWTVAVAAGYLAWSWFAHSRPTAIVALAAVGVTLALASAPAWGVQLGVGIAMVVGGLVLRSGPEA
jgi:hypothetical protein